jgi:hypothetical protein
LQLAHTPLGPKNIDLELTIKILMDANIPTPTSDSMLGKRDAANSLEDGKCNNDTW